MIICHLFEEVFDSDHYFSSYLSTMLDIQITSKVDNDKFRNKTGILFISSVGVVQIYYKLTCVWVLNIKHYWPENVHNRCKFGH